MVTLTVGIQLDLSPYRTRITQWLTHSLQRDVTIAGDMKLTLSFSPSFYFSGIKLANMKGYEWKPMAEVGTVEARISVLPLVTKTLKIDSAKLENIRLNLLRSRQGKANWVFFSTHETPQKTTNPPSDEGLLPYKLVLSEDIAAKNIQILFQDQSSGTFFDWSLATMDLQQKDHDWLLKANGKVMGQPYDLSVAGGIDQLINNRSAELKLTGKFAGAELNAETDIVPFEQGNSQLSINLNWANTQPLQALLGLDVAPMAPLSLKSRIMLGKNNLSVSQLQLNSPVAQASGKLDLQLGEHNTIDGQLTIPQVDFSPWIQSAAQPKPRAVFFGAAPRVKSPLQMALDKWLVNTSTHIAMELHEVKGLGTDINNISLNIKGEQGLLSAPMTADIAEVPFEGEARIDSRGWVSTVNIDLEANDAPLGTMASWLSSIKGSHGHLDKAKLSLSTQGTKLKEWIGNSQLEFNLKDTRLKWGEQGSWAIDQATFQAGMTRKTDISVSGQLMSVPASLRVSSGTLLELIQKKTWYTAIDFSSPALTLKAKGELAAGSWIKGSWFNLDVTSQNIHKMNPWLGTNSTEQGRLKLTGKLSTDGEQALLTIAPMQLMDSTGKLTVRWRPEPEKMYLFMDARFKTLNLTQIADWVGSPPANSPDQYPQSDASKIAAHGLELDLPILSSSIVIADADLNFGIDTINWSNQVIKEVQLQGKIRDGWLKQSPFSAYYAGGNYRGNMQLDLRDRLIKAGFNLSVTTPDIGQMMANFGVTDNLDMTLDSAKIGIQLKGRTLQELMDQASIDAQLAGGTWNLFESYTGKSFPIAINRGSFITGPETATQLIINGEVDSLPLAITLDAISLAEANDGRNKFPVTLDIKLGDMIFNAESSIALPINRQQVDLAIHGFTPNLSRFNRFMKVDLPPYGPITLAGNLSMDSQGYRLKELMVKVNHSYLNGNGSIIPGKSNKDKTNFNLKLKAPFIQIDDFAVENWQAWLPAEDQSEPDEHQKQLAQSNKPAPFLSPDSLQLMNANFQLDVDEVRSGNDWLGAGQLHWQLKDGQLTVEPLKVMLPGGEIDFAGVVKAVNHQFDIALNGGADHFDYGILARRIKPDSDMQGMVSLAVDVNSRSETPDTLMDNASGNLRFAVWPKQFEAGIIDLWAIGLVDAVMPAFNQDNQSLLNCTAGSFVMKKGQMQQKKVLLDTSRIQVDGEVEADFANKTLNVYLTPRSKKAQIFSLQTPIQVTGQFEDFSLNVPLSAILKTSVRFTTSPVVSPLRWLLETPLDKDGSLLCEQIMKGKA